MLLVDSIVFCTRSATLRSVPLTPNMPNTFASSVSLGVVPCDALLTSGGSISRFNGWTIGRAIKLSGVSEGGGIGVGTGDGVVGEGGSVTEVGIGSGAIEGEDVVEVVAPVNGLAGGVVKSGC